MDRRAARQVRPHPRAGPELRHPVRRSGRVQALAEGDPARRAEPSLHHEGQHAAHRRRRALLPGHRPHARVVRVEQLHLGDHAARADDAALGDRPPRARQDLRGARLHQFERRGLARRGGAELGGESAALRDQGPHPAQRDPALDAGADHRRTREARAHRRVGGAQAGADQPRHRRARVVHPALGGRTPGRGQPRDGRGRGHPGGGRRHRARDRADRGRDPPARRHGGRQPAGGREVRRRAAHDGQGEQHDDRARQSRRPVEAGGPPPPPRGAARPPPPPGPAPRRRGPPGASRPVAARRRSLAPWHRTRCWPASRSS